MLRRAQHERRGWERPWLRKRRGAPPDHGSAPLRQFATSLVLLLALLNVAHAQPSPPATAPLRFITHGPPQAQFAGPYLAVERGFYSSHGLSVSIAESSPDHSAATALERGDVDCATLLLVSAIRLRDRGVPIVNVAQIIQRSALMLVTKKSSGIKHPREMNGRKLGVRDGDLRIQPDALFKQLGIEPQILRLDSVNLFLRDAVAVTAAFWYSDYHTILSSGLNTDELQLFFFSDYDLNFPEDGLYCREDLVAAHPERAKAFVKATFAGWTYASAHPEEAIDVVLKRVREAQLGTNRPHQRWMLARMQDLITPTAPEDPIGWLSESDYQRVGRALLTEQIIRSIPEYKTFFWAAATDE